MTVPRVPGFQKSRTVSVELTRPVPDIEAAGYHVVLVLARIDRVPVGCFAAPVIDGVCDCASLWRISAEQLQPAITRQLAERAVGAAVIPARPLPSVTVAICTRDRAADLARCLDAVDALSPPPDEVLVVDNASRDAATRDVAARHPRARYVHEPQPGLDRARNRAIAESRSDIVAFTDDDVVVDPLWVGALRRAFADDPQVQAVTGLVMPLEMETPAQLLFERYGGFGRGFIRRSFHVDRLGGERAARLHGGTGKFGTGANMAFRRAVFTQIGEFDPALDVGTVTNGGGDLDMFFRVLRAGHTLRYEPAAIVFHRHRRSYDELRRQIANNGIGFYSYLVRNALVFPDERGDLIRLGIWWFWYWNVRRWLTSLLKPGKFPRDLVTAELTGSLVGLRRYHRARRIAGDAVAASADKKRGVELPAEVRRHAPQAPDVADATVDIDRAIGPVTGVSAVGVVWVHVTRGGERLGTIRIVNGHRDISRDDLIAQIVEQLGAGRVLRVLGERARLPAPAAALSRRSSITGISVVVATFDRPADLRRCLQSLAAQRWMGSVEIIVVDNHPASGVTPAVVAEFPGVRLVSEARQGLSYARNAGIADATGEVIVATDDDVVAPDEWLARLVEPFDDPAVMVVTGNVIPAELSAESQRLFEAYGGLGRGTERLRVDHGWFWSFRGAVPTWLLGATANAAFRATMFADADIGLMDEALGAGMPTGCSEDTYVFYKVLRAGYAIVYEPSAFVWHHHRADMRALRRQIYAYAKGHVAYQLRTLFREGDLRALTRLFVQLPAVYVSRVRARLKDRHVYPLRLVALEVAGTLAGPFALWRSCRRVARMGASRPYLPPATRSIGQDAHASTPKRPEARSYAL
jgi:GT2 family glycosyltransferase